MTEAVYLGIGSNLGNRRANMALALRMLEPLAKVDAVSSLYESEPQAPAGPPGFLNAACRVVTGLPPRLLLNHVRRIEAAIGRHAAAPGEPRPIDLDVLLYAGKTVTEAGLAIPHPRMMDRAFVLRPLLDIDAGLLSPDSQLSLADRLTEISEGGLRLIEGAGWETGPS